LTLLNDLIMKHFTLSFRLLIIVTAALPLQAQVSSKEKKYFKLLQAAFNEQNAYHTVWFVEQRWRIAGNSGFNESIFYVEKILQQAGFIQEKNGESDDRLTYRIEKRPMKRVTWDPVDAQLF